MSNKVDLFRARIDAITMQQAVSRLQSWLNADADDPDASRCRYVVTPNIDHTVMLNESPQLREVYEHADMVLADGWPVVTAARLLGKPLPERVPGSDLVPCLFDAADKAADQAKPGEGEITVFLLGAMPGVADTAAENIHNRWSRVKVVGTYSPPFGFEHDEAECESILAMIEQASPHVLVVGLGAPKQEFWVHQHRDRIQAKAALCVGATIDFLAGSKARAPRWIQKLGLEWFHRMASEPKRLVKRYARDAWVFPQLVLREWWLGAKRA